jgi:hypothetical protein
MHQEILGTLCLVPKFRKLTEIQPSEVGCNILEYEYVTMLYAPCAAALYLP